MLQEEEEEEEEKQWKAMKIGGICSKEKRGK